MSGRQIDPGVSSSLGAGHVVAVLLIELNFDSATVYLAAAPHDIEWNGNTYISAQGIGAIEPVTETSAGAQGLKFTLAAATPASIAGFFTEEIQGRKVTLRLAVIDPAAPGGFYVDPSVWSGTFDIPQLKDDAKPVITVTAEHEMLAWQTPSGALFSHEEQQLVDPTDLFFQYAAEMSEKTLVWPTKEALK